MDLRDIPPESITRLYELFRTVWPRRTEYLRVKIRLGRPDLSENATRKRVVCHLLGDDPRLYRLARGQLSIRRSEPRGYSPLEQIKIRTGVLYPTGELTGGNYGTSF